MYQFLVDNGLTKIHFHVITDGRDTDIHASYKYIKMLSQGCTKKSTELLKMVDVDLENIKTYEITADFYNQKITELENILKDIKTNKI